MPPLQQCQCGPVSIRALPSVAAVVYSHDPLASSLHTLLPWPTCMIRQLRPPSYTHHHCHGPKAQSFKLGLRLSPALADQWFYSHSSLYASMNPPFLSTACCWWLLTSGVPRSAHPQTPLPHLNLIIGRSLFPSSPMELFLPESKTWCALPFFNFVQGAALV